MPDAAPAPRQSDGQAQHASNRTSSVAAGRRSRRPLSRSRRLSGMRICGPSASTRASELDGEERVPARHALDRRERRPRRARDRAHHEGAGASEAEAQRRRPRSHRADRRTRLRCASTPCCVRRVASTATRSRSVTRRTAIPITSAEDGIEPLHVVQRNEHGADRRESSRRTSRKAETERTSVRRRPVRLYQEQRDLERAPPGRGELRDDLVEDIRQEIGQPGERESGLGLHAAVLQNGPAGSAGCLDARLPEHGLADPRLPGEQQTADGRVEKALTAELAVRTREAR